MSDDASWPTAESVRKEIAERERIERVKSKYKGAAYTTAEASKVLSTERALREDANRSWRRR